MLTGGMSSREVERANKFPLSKPRFVPDNFLGRPVADHRRFTTFEIDAPEFILFGRNTKLEYTFFDNRLFRYHLSVEGTSASDIDPILFPRLQQKYGDSSSAPETKLDSADFPIQRCWVGAHVRVDYFVHRRGLATIEVTYIPIDEEIHRISATEKAKIFRQHTTAVLTRVRCSKPLRASRHLLPPPPFHPQCRCRAALRER